MRLAWNSIQHFSPVLTKIGVFVVPTCLNGPAFWCCPAGQWVSWKRAGDKAAAGGDLFVANAHYNLLRPQRPVTV